MSERAKNYNDPETLYLGLVREENGAIIYLYQKSLALLQSWRLARPVSDMEKAELAQDTVVRTIQKIKAGAFQFDGRSPCAYANAVAQNLLSNRLRKKKPLTVPMQEWDASEEPEVEKYFYNKELQRLLADALNKMSENCRRLITLFHLEEKTDEEILRSGSTPYSTLRSLTSSRGECMKKLRLLMAGLKKRL